MIDEIKKLVGRYISQYNEIPEDKKDQVADTAANSLMEGLKQYADPGMLASLLGGESGSAGSLKGVEDKIASALTSIAGLDNSLSSKIAASVVPAVMSLLSKKADGDSGFDIGSALKDLTVQSGDNSDGGLASMLGGLLGGKK